MSVLPELSVVDVSEVAMVTSSLSVAVGIGWEIAGVNGDWGSVVVSVGWSSAAVIL